MRETAELWVYEREARAQGFTAVCGVDEAGAGPLMGPVYAAAVILPEDCGLPELNDSKKLTEKKREKLFPLIKERAIAWSVARVEASEIDETDILSARMKAMQLAIDVLAIPADYALIDGNRDHGRSAAITTPHETVVGGDGRSASIAAASVLAKVSRDHFMLEMAQKYPQYAFERHKGYGTKRHYEALRQSSAGGGTNENSYFPFIENFLSTLYMCYKELDKRFAVVHGKKITKKARVEATVLNSLTPLSKAEICKILPDVSPTTVEAVLGAMVKTGSIKRIGAGRTTRYIKC